MKVVILGPAYPYRGGIAAFTERLAYTYILEGHDVFIFTFSLQYPSFLFPGKSQFVTNSEAPKNLNILRTINSFNPISWYITAQKIKKINPDIVLCKFWIPFIAISFGYILLLLNNKIKKIGIIHNLIPHEKKIGDTMFSRFFIKNTTANICMSKSVLKDFNDLKTSKKITLSPHPIYNYGATDSITNAAKQLKLSTDFKYILFFGIVRDYKGLDLLLEAFAIYKTNINNVKLIVAGEFYSNESYFMALIEKLNLNNDIILHNHYIADADVAHYFNTASVVVQPYKHATQSGVTQIAYHFEKPMIVTNVGGLSEIVPNLKVGYVVEPNAIDIENGIRTFFNLKNDDYFKENIIEEKKKYDWSFFTAKINDLITT